MGDDRQRIFEEAQGEWPSIDISFEVFSQHLDKLEWTDSLPPQPASLYLCIACAIGVESACWELERRYLGTLRSTLGRVVRQPDLVEESLQVVRARLLTGPKARIATYRGQGPLETWLRVVATRIALDELRSRKRTLRHENRLAQHFETSLVEEASAESSLFRHEHAPAIRRALERGLSGLPLEDRRLLRLSLVQGLSIDALGKLYEIHRSSAARRVARSRQRAYEAVKNHLQHELGELSTDEFASLISTLYSDLETTLSGLLATHLPTSLESAAESVRKDRATRVD